MVKNKLYILCGIPFSGKSVLANELVKRFNYTKISLDEIKSEIFGKEITDGEIDQVGWDKIYQEMYKRIEENLKKEKTVIQDAGNFTKYERGLVRQIATKLSIVAVTIFVDTPKNIARERLLRNRQTKERFNVSDKDFESTVAEMEPPGNDEESITYRYQEEVDRWIEKFWGAWGMTGLVSRFFKSARGKLSGKNPKTDAGNGG